MRTPNIQNNERVLRVAKEKHQMVYKGRSVPPNKSKTPAGSWTGPGKIHFKFWKTKTANPGYSILDAICHNWRRNKNFMIRMIKEIFHFLFENFIHAYTISFLCTPPSHLSISCYAPISVTFMTSSFIIVIVVNI